MKKSALIIFAFFVFTFNGFSQSCLPEGIMFWNQQQIDDFQANYPGCTEIEGDIEIAFDVTNLNGLFPIESIGGNLWIHNEMMENLSGLHNLVFVEGNCRISVSLQMSNLTGLGSLEFVGGGLDIYDNYSLNSLTGLDNLETIDGGLIIFGNTNLPNLEGIENLVMVNSSIQIMSNNSLNSLSGLDKFINNPIWLRISDNNALTSLSGINFIDAGLIYNLDIEFNSSLSTCNVQSICDYIINQNGNITIFMNAPGCNTESEIYEACLTQTNETLAIKNEIQLFPNPAKNTITILNSSKAKINEVIIFSPSGKTILQKKGPENSINISKLLPGLYFVEVETGIGNVRKKLIVE